MSQVHSVTHVPVHSLPLEAFAVVFVLRGGALRGGWTARLRFSLACLGFSFLFRGVQRGYFSFQRERREIMKVGELLISAK